MKCELDANFALKGEERALARAAEFRNTPQSKKVSERGREFLESYQREHSRRKKAYA
jgi:hypothetical protein